MTVIILETHVTQDPTYDPQDNSAMFTVALSSFIIPCHIHRIENLKYLTENEVRIGDLVRLQGVFIINGSNHLSNYIKVQTVTLKSKEFIGKKRKLENNHPNFERISITLPPLTLPPTLSTVTPMTIDSILNMSKSQYKLTDLNFSDYYFMMSGQAYRLLDCCNSYQSKHGMSCKNTQEKGFILSETLTRLYILYDDIIMHGLSRSQVMNFVEIATSFVTLLNEVKNMFPAEILPARVYISQNTPLPLNIYNALND